MKCSKGFFYGNDQRIYRWGHGVSAAVELNDFNVSDGVGIDLNIKCDSLSRRNEA